MKTPFDEGERQRIRQAKQILRHLWKQSNVSMDEVLEQLGKQGLPLKKSTLSTWFSLKPDNIIRPKEDYLEPMVMLFLPAAKPEQRQEVCDELRQLLDYAAGPMPSESLRNRLAEQLDENLGRTLRASQHQLSVQLEALESLLEAIEPRILDYDKGFPVIRIEEEGSLKLLRQLLGKDRALHAQFSVEGGYEIPLTRVQSLETITEIINLLNEGSRLLRAYVERHMLDDGWLSSDLPRIEDFVTYCWEISDRLLHHNLLCKSVPALKRTLLRIMATCWGIRYILENQQGSRSEVQFQNLLALKGKTSQADIQCSVAVYMGMLARQCVRSKAPSRLERGYSLYTRAAKLLKDHHEQLNTAQEVYFYKKELANLHFDIANLSLACAEFSPTARQVFKPAIEAAAVGYAQVLDEDHVFYQGLSPQRAQHLRLFHVLSQCWTAPKPERALPLIEAMLPGEVLNESYWTAQIARAMAYSILALRSRGSVAAGYRETGLKALEQAALVSGFAERTRTEIESEYMLGILKSPGASRVLSLIG